MNEVQQVRVDKPDIGSVAESVIEPQFHRSWLFSRSVWFATVSLVVSMAFSTLSAQGQENGMAVQSKAFAEESERLLGTGKQRAAIIEALKGLPEPFTEETISNYPEAWLSFFRAATALVVATSYGGDIVAVANQDRTRVVFKGILATDRPSLDAVTPTVLWDAESNREIAVVAKAPETNDDSMMLAYELSTSPGSNLFSLAGAGSQQIRLFDIEKGIEVGSLPIPPQSTPFGMSPIGISPDGTKFAASSADTISVWDLANFGAPRMFVPQLPEGTDGLQFVQVKWTSEQDFVATYTWLQGPRQGQIGLARIYEDGTVQSVESEGDDYHVISIVSQDAPYFVELSSSQGQWLIRDLQLNIVGRIVGEVTPVSFARDQTAIAVLQGMGGMFGEDVTFEPAAIYGLDGTPLELQPADYLGFSDIVFNETGQALAVIGPSEYSATHLSGPMPRAAELHAKVMASLTPEEDAILSAQRLGANGTAPEANQLRLLQSDKIASEAETAMLTGQRHAAIKLALMALPAMPSEADFDTFESAHRALFRAYSSLSAKFDSPDSFKSLFLSRVRFGPAGRTALYRRVVFEETSRSISLVRATVYDLQTGNSTEIDVTSIDERGFTDLSFSPSGLEFVGVGRSDGRVYVFDASTGKVTRHFDASGDTTHSKTVQIGFSPDGKYFAATVGRTFDSKFAIWAAETGRLLYSGAPFKGFATPLGWSHEGSILVVDSVLQADGTIGSFNLVVWSPQGGSSTMPLLRADGRPIEHCQYSAISHARPYLACSADSETTILNFESGNIVGTIRRADSVGTFLRDGSAIGWTTVSNANEIDVFSATGEPIEPILQDYVPFGQLAFLKGSDLTRVAADLSGYTGQDIPIGIELYEAAMAELSEDERAQLLLALPDIE